MLLCIEWDLLKILLMCEDVSILRHAPDHAYAGTSFRRVIAGKLTIPLIVNHISIIESNY